jgi:hypothetical protein
MRAWPRQCNDMGDKSCGQVSKGWGQAEWRTGQGPAVWNTGVKALGGLEAW